MYLLAVLSRRICSTLAQALYLVLWQFSILTNSVQFGTLLVFSEQESPAIADKPARRESLPKIAPIRRAYNVVADNTGLSSFG